WRRRRPGLRLAAGHPYQKEAENQPPHEPPTSRGRKALLELRLSAASPVPTSRSTPYAACRKRHTAPTDLLPAARANHRVERAAGPGPRLGLRCPPRVGSRRLSPASRAALGRARPQIAPDTRARWQAWSRSRAVHTQSAPTARD